MMLTDIARNDLYSSLWRSTIDLLIVNPLSKIKWQYSSYIVYNFCAHPSNNLGVYAVKTRNFAAIRP